MAFISEVALGVNFDRTYTGSEEVESGFALGTRATGDDGREYVFVQAQGAITALDILAMASGYDCPPLSGAGEAAFVAHVDIANNERGWVVAKGIVDATVGTSVADKDELARLTDSSGDLIILAEAVASGVFAVALEDDSSGVASIYIF